MYSFHYDFMKNIFNYFKLLFTDTDSLCYETCDENPYENFYEHKEYFDLSNYSKDSKYFCNDNEKVLAKMKDEYGRNVIKEFIELRSKTYSIIDTKNNEKSTHKGHNSYIKYGEFCDTLFNKKVLRHKMRGIKSKIHNLMTLQVIKHLHLVLMIKYIFKKTELIHYHMDIKTSLNQKNIYIYICFIYISSLIMIDIEKT